MTAKVFHAHLYGTRQAKYHRLAEADVTTTQWMELRPAAPFYLFAPQDANLRAEYEQAWTITEAMPVKSAGIVTGQDKQALACARVEAVALAHGHGLPATSVVPALYRPFDVRFMVYHKSVVTRPRLQVMRHMLAGANLGILVTRQTRDEWGVLATAHISGHKACAAFDINTLVPLYLYPDGDVPQSLLDHENDRRPNFSARFIAELSARLKCTFVPEGRGDLRKTVGPGDIFHYAYAVFHSPAYRARYAEVLKIDFPRLPLTSDLRLFRALAAKGAALVALHLLESPKLEQLLTDWPVKGDNVVERVQYTEKDGRVWINKTQYFGGVPKPVWEFHVGGYQVCHKWLKDRKGRKLTYDDTQHYQKVVVALNETIRLMAEIDETIGQHGGWPMR